MSYKRVLRRRGSWFMIEALTFGLAYGAGLCWASVCLLASFRPDGLSDPYWGRIPGLRTDTSGIIAFCAVALFLTCSEFLRLRRRQMGNVIPERFLSGGLVNAAASAACETVGLLATGARHLSLDQHCHPSDNFEHAGYTSGLVANRGNSTCDRTPVVRMLRHPVAPIES